MIRLRPFSWLILGPVTGPLAALAWWGMRNRRPVVTALAVTLIADFWICAPALLAALTSYARTLST